MDPNQSYARKEGALSLLDEMENPGAVGAGQEVLLPASLFPKGCKKGSTVMVKGTVGSMGSKVGFTPSEVVYEGGNEGGPMQDDEEAEGEQP